MARAVSPVQFSLGFLPIAIVGMVIIMMIPLPAGLLDLLLVLNICLGVILLLSVIYTSEAEKLTSLPTVLLLATIFRLGINVSTTRQLLAEGVAPTTVSAFGNFVVHGNLAVGTVVFAIITLVQFLVIAKGGERVAEVAARFALDAMPGKQMSIDADVRAGLMSLAEAKIRRERLQRESKLYGSLDGAMKFVKGDAIAGLCITIVNVLGGLCVGSIQHGLPIAEALQRYTLFAIGDGLASQIPALLVAVAAGVAVTRVSGEQGLQLADDMCEQLVTNPQVLLSGGTVMLVIGCMPGLSGLLFWSLALALIGVGVLRIRQVRELAKNSQEELFRPTVVPGILLSFSTVAAEKLQHEGTLPTLAQSLREEFFKSDGLFLQDVQFEINDETTNCDVVLSNQGETVSTLSLSTLPTQSSLSNEVIAMMRDCVETRREEFVDDTQVRLLFDVHRATSDDVVNSLVPNKLSVTEITSVLKMLVRERVSIRSFGRILQAIAEVELQPAGAGAQLAELNSGLNAPLLRRVAAVRMMLRRQICSPLLEDEVLRGHLIEPELDTVLASSLSIGGSIEPDVLHYIRTTIAAIIENEGRAILVSSTGCRFALASILCDLMPKVTILSAEEIEHECEFVAIDVIRLAEASQEATTEYSARGDGVSGSTLDSIGNTIGAENYALQ